MKKEQCRRVLVTGATGFVGKAVIEALRRTENVEIHIVTRRQPETLAMSDVRIHQADILEKREMLAILEQVCPQYLVHLAWNVTPGEYLNNSENVRWLATTLELAKQFYEQGGERAFFCGTCFEYEFDNYLASAQNTPLHPISLYAECKADAYRVIKKYCEANNYSYCWGRIFFLYGEGEDERRVVPYIIRNLLKNEPVICKNGDAVRDYIYVKDAGNMIVQKLFSKQSGACNIASGRPVTMAEVFLAFGKACGKEELIYIENNPVIPQRIVADMNNTSFEKISLEQGARATVEWWIGKEDT